MSNSKDTIIRLGVIRKVEDDRIIVNIIAQSVCASCYAKGMCSVADMEEKSIEVHRKPGHNYKPGEKVTVAMEKSLGTKAVIILSAGFSETGKEGRIAENRLVSCQ